jgi:hypothetical protein
MADIKWLTYSAGRLSRPTNKLIRPSCNWLTPCDPQGSTRQRDIEIDGQLHRFSTKGRKRDDSGWYIAFPR